MQAADVMTRRIISVSPEARVETAIELMLKNKISGLPVIDAEGRICGIVTEGDLVRRPEIGTERKRSRWLDAFVGPSEAAECYVRSHSRTIKDIMTANPVTVGADAPLDEIVQLMEKHNIKRVPVVQRGKVVGMVTRANIVRALVSVQREAATQANNDLKIKKQILADIARQGWSYGASIDVVVRHGIVDLWGTLVDPAQRKALNVLVSNTPGVRKVIDHLM